ncbi:hypothetical protein THAOC_28102, partial [Thalassiosira oceanica]
SSSASPHWGEARLATFPSHEQLLLEIWRLYMGKTAGCLPPTSSPPWAAAHHSRGGWSSSYHREMLQQVGSRHHTDQALLNGPPPSRHAFAYSVSRRRPVAEVLETTTLSLDGLSGSSRRSVAIMVFLHAPPAWIKSRTIASCGNSVRVSRNRNLTTSILASATAACTRTLIRHSHYMTELCDTSSSYPRFACEPRSARSF